MQIIDTYNTIEKPAEGFFKDRGSKFIAWAFPVVNEEEVQEHRVRLRKKYHDARHHVYAFQIGTSQIFYRASDDGEPANSSGPPVLGQIKSFELTNVLVVVIRYFGGTKLGIPGLINAYKTAAADAIKNANIVIRTISRKLAFRFDYPMMSDIMRIVKAKDIKIDIQDFQEDCKMEVSIKLSLFEEVYNKLEQIKSVKIEKS